MTTEHTEQTTTEEAEEQLDKESQDLLTVLGELVAYGQQYVDDRIKLVKLEMAEVGSKAFSGIVTVTILGVIFTLGLIFGSIALGFFLGDWLDSYGYGFLIVFGIYILLGAIITFFRRQLITNPILTTIIKEINI